MTYTPQPGTVAHQACRYFHAHRTHRLTARDLAGKLDGASTNTITALLSTALSRQVLARDQDRSTGTWLYTAGPKIDECDFGGGGTAAPAAAPAPVMRAITDPFAPKPAFPSTPGSRSAAAAPPLTTATPATAYPNGKAAGSRVVNGMTIEPVAVRPKTGRRADEQRLEVIAAMNVGESVVMPRNDARNFVQACHKWAKSTANGRKFAQQIVDRELMRIGRVE